MTSPRLCWETGVLPCALFLLPPPLRCCVSHTYTLRKEWILLCMFAGLRDPPPPLCGEAALAVVCGWVWSESGVSAEG